MSRRKMAIEVFSAPGGRCADFDQRYLGDRRNMDAEGFVALQDPSDELADILLCGEFELRQADFLAGLSGAGNGAATERG